MDSCTKFYMENERDIYETIQLEKEVNDLMLTPNTANDKFCHNLRWVMRRIHNERTHISRAHYRDNVAFKQQL